MRLTSILLIVSTMIVASCGQKNIDPMEGIWRAVLTNELGSELPFNFEWKTLENDRVELVIINAEERIVVDEIEIKGDSMFVKMPVFDSEFRIKLTKKNMQGEWVKHYGQGKSKSMPFSAEFDQKHRFFAKNEQKPAKMDGKWAITFVSGEDTIPAIGVFEQDDKKLWGTILTATGDYRYLEGGVKGNKFALSCFDGSHAFLFEGELINDTIQNATFISGGSYQETWTAYRDDNASLPDAYSLTYLKEGYDKVFFTFPNLDSHLVSLSDVRFQNKVVVIQIMGSWCPNCMDETAYLSEYYLKNREKGLEIVALAFERSPIFKEAIKNLKRLQSKYEIQYPILLAGTSNKEEAALKLPMLNHIMSFPTTIILNRKGEVVKIHTGFNGPGTGKLYTKWVKEFESLMKELYLES